MKPKSISQKKSSPTWSDVKAKLADFDCVGLLGLVQDLYAASKDNQTFLHTRFELGSDALKLYKAVISRWICPDVMRNQPISVAKAKKAISDYKKATGHPEGLAELAVFYCEEVFVFLSYCGRDDEGYFDALLQMFGQALKYVMVLPEPKSAPFLDRLDCVRSQGRDIGWGVGDGFDELWSRTGLEAEE
jgi:hypothetical protein